MSNRFCWKAAAVLSAVLYILANQCSLAQSAGGCDPNDPTCNALGSGINGGMIPQMNPSQQQVGGSINDGSINAGSMQQLPGQSSGFNPATGFPPTPNYTDNQTRNGTNDWWQQYRFNPERALALARKTQFQLMVASSTGRMIPIYGADLFWGSPSTFAPVEQIPVTPSYLTNVGDELLVKVWGQVSLSASVTVDRSGAIYLPQVGSIQVAGIPYSALQDTVRARIAKIYRNFNLSVTMGQLHSIRVYVTGEARQPGSFTVSSLSTLVSALYVTGGPAPQGSFRHIQVRREGQVITDFDLYALLVYGDKSKDVPLLPGDVIYIPPVGPQAALFGSVKNSAIYELKSDTTVAELIKDAGGLSVLASLSNAAIERIGAKHERTTVQVSLTTGQGELMRDGDILRVTSISPRFTQTVTIRGNVADPGRFGWREGMKLSDLIPDTASLVTRNYWERRNRSGIPSPDFEPDASQQFDLQQRNYQQANQNANLQNSQYGTNLNQRTQGQTGQSLVPLNGSPAYQQTNQSGTVNGQDTFQQLASQTGGTGSDSGTQLNPNLPDCPASVLAPNAIAGQQVSNLVPGVSCNIRTYVLGGTTLADQQGRTYTENTAGADRINDVRLPAPDIDWSYAVIERLDPKTFQTTLVPFDLGKLALSHDPSQDLTLEPGDIITVFSQADIRVPLAQQTKLVRLEGEVARAGIYSVQPGETLGQLLTRAGGLTPNAYLYGAEFTRASTRIAQQARLDDYVSTLELEIDRAAVASSANALSAQDTASSQSTLQTTQLLIARLKLLRASGRIVLNLQPKSQSLSDLPPLSLEDGDRLVVPAIPSSINVVGSVYDPSSFLYDGHARVSSYLKQAGGPNRDADSKHVFIVRADGAVISKEASKSFWGNTFADENINPGDTIVVPEKVYRGSSLRAFSSYAQLFSSLALGIAYFRAIQ